MKKVEIEVGVLELRRSFSFFLGGGVDHMVFKGKGGGQSSSKEYKRGTIENEGGGNKNITDLWGEGKFFGEFYSDTIKILQKTPPSPRR